MSVLFKDFSDVCSPAKGKRCLQKKPKQNIYSCTLTSHKVWKTQMQKNVFLFAGIQIPTNGPPFLRAHC